MNIEPKIYSQSITFKPESFKVSSRLDKSLQAKIKCAGHNAGYILSDNNYRKYKRGKNRCSGCGVKL